GELVAYRIEVGRVHGVTPREIVGAIANEGGLSSREIGRIDLHDDYSVVDLPADLPNEVLGVLRKTRVMQQALELRRTTSGEGSEAVAPRPERQRKVRAPDFRSDVRRPRDDARPPRRESRDEPRRPRREPRDERRDESRSGNDPIRRRAPQGKSAAKEHGAKGPRDGSAGARKPRRG
ncbi:MAG TPA: DbpA RNA binding domain-containing protein, partial [Pseudomonadales bacterium]|nr:DbpA RNA binding domain-containing protein [Pseudomonadales bacterium]